MKKRLALYILSTFLLFTLYGFGQTKNHTVKKINGIDYYQYTIEVSEGLFAIARKFDVMPEDISNANPELKKGLKVGQQILIPVKINADQQKNSTKTLSTKIIEHKVEKKQTLFAISNKYNVSQEDIKKLNPEIANGLREGLILKIPVQTLETKKALLEKVTPTDSEKKQNSTTKAEKFIIHLIQADETLYSISKKYKVEIAEIIELNSASINKLTIGTELKIPSKNEKSSSTSKNSEESSSKQTDSTNTLLNSNLTTHQFSKNKNIRIAFLLPFMLSQDKKDANIDRFLDFYAGALIAIKQAKEKGISFEIHTFDTEKSEEKIAEILSNSELKTMDLIIGPAFTNLVSLVADFAKENKINTLIPFTSKISDIGTNPYLFQFNPGADAELIFATDLFLKKHKNTNLIFAELPGISSMDDGKTWAEKLKRNLKSVNRAYSTAELTNTETMNLSSIVRPDAKNIIIFNTDKYAYVSPYIKPIKNLAKDCEIVVFEQYSWRNQTEKFPKTICLSPFITNIKEDKLSSFNLEFSHYFGSSISTESPRFDLLGYDLTSYFSALINKFGKKYASKIGPFNYNEGIQSKLTFEQTSNESGFVNQQIYLTEE